MVNNTVVLGMVSRLFEKGKMENFNGEGEGQKFLDRTAAVCFSSSYKTGRLLPTCARVALDLAAVAYVFIVSIVPGILYLYYRFILLYFLFSSKNNLPVEYIY